MVCFHWQERFVLLGCWGACKLKILLSLRFIDVSHRLGPSSEHNSESLQKFNKLGRWDSYLQNIKNILSEGPRHYWGPTCTCDKIKLSYLFICHFFGQNLLFCHFFYNNLLFCHFFGTKLDWKLKIFHLCDKIQLTNLFKMLKLAVFHSMIYSFKKKTRVSNWANWGGRSRRFMEISRISRNLY